jgi:hypothetical protein
MTFTREDLYSLEQYSEIRAEFKAKVLAHKANRKVHLGPNATLYFEDALTLQYQIQEMLRIEKVFDAEGIQDELDAYNPLMPNGSNWKATFMIEYGDVGERRQALSQLIGIEDKIWVQIGAHDKVYSIANEDLPRSTEEKTSAVHFMRFELTAEMVNDAKSGAKLRMGSDHPNYPHTVDPVTDNNAASLVKDLT